MKTAHIKNILLTYGWVRSSYSVLRNLSSHGLQVYVADSSRIGMSQCSKYKAGFDKYTSHYENEIRFVQDIADICEKRSIDYIIPSHNETEVLARNREYLPANCSVLLPDADTLSIFDNKASAHELAKSLGINVPKRLNYSNPNHISKLIENSGIINTVIKLRRGNSSKGVFYAQNPAQAQEIAIKLISDYKLPEERYPIVEERVNGEGWGVSVLYWKGKNVADFTHKRLREKIESGGTSTLRKASQNSDLVAEAHSLFTHMQWHGFAMMEFKVCPNTGNYWFIEINPRLWGSLPLAIAAGTQFPYLAHLCITEGIGAAKKFNANSTHSTNWTARWLLGDLAVFARLIVQAKWGSAYKILTDTNYDSIDDFYWDDPGAFFGELIHYTYKSIMNLSFNSSERGMLG